MASDLHTWNIQIQGEPQQPEPPWLLIGVGVTAIVAITASLIILKRRQ